MATASFIDCIPPHIPNGWIMQTHSIQHMHDNLLYLRDQMAKAKLAAIMEDYPMLAYIATLYDSNLLYESNLLSVLYNKPDYDASIDIFPLIRVIMGEEHSKNVLIRANWSRQEYTKVFEKFGAKESMMQEYFYNNNWHCDAYNVERKDWEKRRKDWASVLENGDDACLSFSLVGRTVPSTIMKSISQGKKKKAAKKNATRSRR